MSLDRVLAALRFTVFEVACLLANIFGLNDCLSVCWHSILLLCSVFGFC